jgi:uncharacterized tellurite resistance protein B-like protein
MLAQIRDFFEQHLRLDENQQTDREEALRLAAAALLLEMTRMDHQVLPEELNAVLAAIQDHFRLSEQRAKELFECAEVERAKATDYYHFTSLINQSYTAEQKAKLIELLWRVAFADSHLHKYEEHLVRKIADLLYVPHSAFIAAKHRAQTAAEEGKPQVWAEEGMP